MKNIKLSFEKYCGEKFDKFMNRLQVNQKGDIELLFWQKKLVESFLASHPEYKIDIIGLLEIIRTGSEMVYKCPAHRCWGDVTCLDYKEDFWGCCECGMVWKSKQELIDKL